MSITRTFNEGGLEAVRFLLKTQPNTNINEQDENGDTVLHLGIKKLFRLINVEEKDCKKYNSLMELLLQEGIDINIKNNAGLTVTRQYFFNRPERFNTLADVTKTYIQLVLKYSPQKNVMLDIIDYLDLRGNPNRRDECFSYKYSHTTFAELKPGYGYVVEHFISVVKVKDLPLFPLRTLNDVIEHGYFKDKFVHESDLKTFQDNLKKQINYYGILHKLLIAIEILNKASEKDLNVILRGMLLSSQQYPLYVLLEHIRELHGEKLPENHQIFITFIFSRFEDAKKALTSLNAIPADLTYSEKEKISTFCKELSNALCFNGFFDVANTHYAENKHNFCQELKTSNEALLLKDREIQREKCEQAASKRVSA